MGKRFYQIFLFGLAAGVLTGLAFASSYFGRFDLRNLWEQHLEVAAVAVAVGLILGALLSLWAYFCLWDKKIFIILPLLCFLACLTTIWLTLFGHRIGWDFLGAWGALVFWVAALSLAGFFAPEDERLKCRR